MPALVLSYLLQLHGLHAQDVPHGQFPPYANAKPPTKRLIPSTAGRMYFFILFSFLFVSWFIRVQS